MTEANVRLVLIVHVALVAASLGGLAAAGFDPLSSDLGPWWSGFVVANLGLLAGNVAMVWLVRQPAEARFLAAETRRQDLQDNRGIVVEQLRQLDAEREKLSAEDYARERAHLVAIGTAASRELAEGSWLTVTDDGASAPATAVGVTSPGTSPASGQAGVDALARRLQQERSLDPALFDAALSRAGISSSPGGEWRGALYTVLVLVLVGAIGWAASSSSRARAPGGSITGGESVGGMESPAGPAGVVAPSPREVAVARRLETDPRDLEALNELTEIALAKEDRAAAMSANQRALEVAPQDPDARVFRAVLLAFVDQLPAALTSLDEVIAEHPTNVRALVYRGLLSLRQEPAKAVEVLEKAAALDPSPQVQALLDEARRRVAGPSAAPPASEAPTPEAAGDVLAAGTLTLAEPGATGQRVFVSLRDPRGGPPLAAITLPPGPFPMTFRITAANRTPMMGGAGPLPANVVLVARLDGDGDAMSRPPSDPSATLEGFAVGTQDVTLTLARSAP